MPCHMLRYSSFRQMHKWVHMQQHHAIVVAQVM